PEPPLIVRYRMFTNAEGQPRPVAEMPGEGPTWLSGLVSLPDRSGRARLVSAYAKIKPPLEVYQWGLCVWNDEAQRFEPLKVVWIRKGPGEHPPRVPEGHAVPWTDGAGR